MSIKLPTGVDYDCGENHLVDGDGTSIAVFEHDMQAKYASFVINGHEVLQEDRKRLMSRCSSLEVQDVKSREFCWEIVSRCAAGLHALNIQSELIIALKKARKYISDIDGLKDDEISLRHECKMITDPINGACDICDMWADLNIAIEHAEKK